METLTENQCKFIIWIQNNEWYNDDDDNLWHCEGYRNRTTQELFEYFLKLRN